MIESQRLAESGEEFERALLDSARAEVPPETGLRRATLALGLAALSAQSAGAVERTDVLQAMPEANGSALQTSGGLGSATLGVLGKSLIGGAIVAVLALGGERVLRARAPEPGTVPVAARGARDVAPSPKVRPSAALPLSEPVATAVASASQSAARSRGATPAARASAKLKPSETGAALGKPGADSPADAQVRSAAPDSAVQQPSVASSLAIELALLDEARAALSVGDVARANQKLDAYASLKPSPVLAQEAALIRVRVLLRQGRRSDAAALARHIIRVHPRSVHDESLKRLAAER